MAQLKLMKKEWFNWFDKTFLDNITAWTEYYYINPDSQHWISNNLIVKNGLVYTDPGYGDIIADNGVLNFKGDNLYTGNRYRYPLYVLNLPSGQYTISVTNNSSYVLDVYPQRTYTDYTAQIQVNPGSSMKHVLDRSILRLLFVFQTQNNTDSWDFTIKISLTRGDTSGLKVNPPLIKIEDILEVLDLGSVNWSNPNTNGWCQTTLKVSARPKASLTEMPYLYCSKYKVGSANYVFSNNESIGLDREPKIVIRSTAFIGKNGTQVKQMLSGVYVVFLKNDAPY